MTIPFSISDPYVRRARLQPALLAALPLALAALSYSPDGLRGWGLLWTIIVASGGTALLAQIARDRGKKKEASLFQRWGGKPTTRLLRHRDAPNDIVLVRRHTFLQKAIADIHIPTANAERENPERADQVYEACTSYLIEKTRDKELFPLVFEENCNYGFRRNLWGMKPLGMTTSAIGFLAIGLLVVLDIQTRAPVPPIAFVCAGVSLLLFLGWIGWFTPSWVKVAADSYAERLLSSFEILPS